MAIVDIFSKRKKRASGKRDVYLYDEIPEPLRVQIVGILVDIIGTPNVGGSPANSIYQSIDDDLCREYGKRQLANGQIPADRLCNFINTTPDLAQVLDAIEISIRSVEQAPDFSTYYRGPVDGRKMSVMEGVNELNFRFQEAGVGYQYESGHMIRVDSQFVHAEIVKPALALLSDQRYVGAQEEFLNAHRHYREHDYKECMTDCLKAFESTMKSICDIRKWPYTKEATASNLIAICFSNGLIPSLLQAQMNALQAVLTSGVPTLRNKMAAHGQGTIPIVVPPSVAAYAMHLTAANIVLLVTAAKGLAEGFSRP